LHRLGFDLRTAVRTADPQANGVDLEIAEGECFALKGARLRVHRFHVGILIPANALI
jgi:hypothetical protein